MARKQGMVHRRNIVLCYFEKQMAALVRIEKKMVNELEWVL
jgi:hypothetical protein